MYSVGCKCGERDDDDDDDDDDEDEDDDESDTALTESGDMGKAKPTL